MCAFVKHVGTSLVPWSPDTDVLVHSTPGRSLSGRSWVPVKLTEILRGRTVADFLLLPHRLSPQRELVDGVPTQWYGPSLRGKEPPCGN